jgi:hypothetical protein
MPDEVERRWADRFGAEVVRALRASLVALAGGPPDERKSDAAHVSGPQQPKDAPCLDATPIVRHGWATRRDGTTNRSGARGRSRLPTSTSIRCPARPLTAFALEFESSDKLSPALHATLLTVLGPDPTSLRDLPDLTGIAREQLDNAVGYLERARPAEVAPTPGAKRGKAVELSTSGAKAKAAGARNLAALEATWDERPGRVLARVRGGLAPLVGGDGPAPSPGVRAGTDPSTAADRSPLLHGLEHPPGTWRAEAKPLARLPASHSSPSGRVSRRRLRSHRLQLTGPQAVKRRRRVTRVRRRRSRGPSRCLRGRRRGG